MVNWAGGSHDSSRVVVAVATTAPLSPPPPLQPSPISIPHLRLDRRDPHSLPRVRPPFRFLSRPGVLRQMMTQFLLTRLMFNNGLTNKLIDPLGRDFGESGVWRWKKLARMRTTKLDGNLPDAWCQIPRIKIGEIEMKCCGHFTHMCVFFYTERRTRNMTRSTHRSFVCMVFMLIRAHINRLVAS